MPLRRVKEEPETVTVCLAASLRNVKDHFDCMSEMTSWIPHKIVEQTYFLKDGRELEYTPFKLVYTSLSTKYQAKVDEES
mmetsp:Transcript_28740/g.65134  ORF Transcript_28740/g.65134 Transcript_28740/m.65134 type:complete len:80 (+) Transcript_28740:721-960(+)